MQRTGIMLVGAAVIFLAGWMLGRGSRSMPPPISSEENRSITAEEKQTAETMEAAVEVRPRASVAAPAPPRDLWAEFEALHGVKKLALLVKFQDRLRGNRIPRMVEFDVGFGSKRRVLTDAFCEAFELTREERAELESAMAEAGEAAGRIELSYAKATLSEDGTQIAITIPPFPGDGGVIYDRLAERFSAVMSGPRKEAFDIGYGSSFDNLYNGLGTRGRDLVVNLVSDRVSAVNTPIFKVEEKWTTGGNHGSSTSNLTWDRVREQMGPLATLLPLEPPEAETQTVEPNP